LALSRLFAAGLMLAALTAAAGNLTAAKFDDGQRAYDAGRFEDAHRIWTALAEDGDAEAQAGLGLLYDLGQGTSREPATAYAWYRRAAETGLARAQFNVAVMLDSGVGVKRDPVQAATWYAKAAAHGHGRAQYNLAQLYASGDGLPRNLAQAEVWYRAAADSGVMAAAAKVAELKSALRSTGPAAAMSAGHLRPVTPMEPVGDHPLVARRSPPTAELVWVAPPQPRPVRFFVEVLAAESDGWRELFAGYVARSAALVQLKPIATRYAWRVYAVADDDAHYAVGGWSQFTVR
jgi:hypothetical protein